MTWFQRGRSRYRLLLYSQFPRSRGRQGTPPDIVARHPWTTFGQNHSYARLHLLRMIDRPPHLTADDPIAETAVQFVEG